MKKKKQWPITAWALVDLEDTYATTLHFSYYEAKEMRARWGNPIDAKWRIVKVTVKPK